MLNDLVTLLTLILNTLLCLVGWIFSVGNVLVGYFITVFAFTLECFVFAV